MSSKEWTEYTISELRRICKHNEVECGIKLKKPQLIKKLEELDEVVLPPPLKKGRPVSVPKPKVQRPSQILIESKVKKLAGKPSIFMHLTSLMEEIDHYKNSKALEKSKLREDLLTTIEDRLENYDWTVADVTDKKNVETFRIKLEKELEESTGGTLDFDEDEDEEPEEEVKPSIAQRLGHVNSVYARFTTTSVPRVKRESLTELKIMLQKYDWSGHFTLRAAIEKSILASTTTGAKPKKTHPVPRGFEEEEKSPPKKSPPKKKPPGPRYVPGVYQPLELGEDIKFGKKETVLPPKIDIIKPRITITLEEFREEIKKPEFIKAFTNSARELMKAKAVVYQKRLAETQREYDSLKLKVFRLRASGTRDKVIEELYPGYDTMGAYIIDIENIIELVKRRVDNITEQEIAEGLEDAIEDPDDGIGALMGRVEIKDQLASQLYSFSKGYKTFFGNFNNMVITGSAGTGKTRLAKTIAFAFSKVGILARGIVKIVTRTELVGQYIGHTAPRTRGALLETLEGILFIDEAYQLTPCPEDRVGGSKDFGSEAITEMVNFLDKYIGLNIVIVAGYEGLMNRCFMTANEGLPRRFPYRYALAPYTIPELTDILVNNLKRKVRDGVIIDGDTANFLYSVVNRLFIDIPDVFKNQAGDMLNLSSNVNNSINSSYRVDWINGDLENNKQILLSGFGDFLESKGYSILSDTSM